MTECGRPGNYAIVRVSAGQQAGPEETDQEEEQDTI
jgi:hypothetical protein